MRKQHILAIGLLAGLGAVVTVAQSSIFVFHTSAVHLESANVIPLPASDAFGKAIIRFKHQFASADIEIYFQDLIGDPTRVHFHCAVDGQNGPIGLGLIDLIFPPFGSAGVVREGNRIYGPITNADFRPNDCAITDLVSLADAIDAGDIYWQLHSSTFPSGEIRGQAAPLVQSSLNPGK